MIDVKKADPAYSDFAYDDAFRTMFVECDDLILPFINYMFKEDHGSSARIIRRGNEHFIEGQGGAESKVITDSCLEIIADDFVKKYHVECESSHTDDSILVRMFEYDTQIALDDSSRDAFKLIVEFPHSGLLLLRQSKNVPEGYRFICLIWRRICLISKAVPTGWRRWGQYIPISWTGSIVRSARDACHPSPEVLS